MFQNRGRVERSLRWRLLPRSQLRQERKSGPGLRQREHTGLMLGIVSSSWRCLEDSWSFCPPGGSLLAIGDWRTSELESSTWLPPCLPSKRTTSSYFDSWILCSDFCELRGRNRNHSMKTFHSTIRLEIQMTEWNTVKHNRQGVSINDMSFQPSCGIAKRGGWAQNTH